MELKNDALNGLSRIFRFIAFRFRRVALGGRTAEAAFTTSRRTALWTTETTALARLTGLPRLTATAAHHLTQLLGGLDVFFFRDAAIRVGVHAFEHLLGITKHSGTPAIRSTGAARTPRAFRSTAWTLPVRWTFGPVALTAWGTAESAFTTGGTAWRTAFRAAHPLPFSTTTHHLGDFANLFLVNKTVAIGIHFGEALLALLAAHAGEFLLADLAITICVGAFDEFGETSTGIAATGRAALRSATFRRRTFAFAFLSAGKAGQAQDSEAVDE